jgi:hypothetical protein
MNNYKTQITKSPQKNMSMEVEIEKNVEKPVEKPVDRKDGPGVRVLEEDDRRMRLVLSGVGSSLANALRRALIGEVDTMAIDFLQIHQNTTSVHDELLFHRLCMLPLVSTAVDSFVSRSECDCEDKCNRCTARFSLSIMNKSDVTVAITSQDLICEDPRVTPIAEKIALCKLAKNQELSFTSYAVKSNSRADNNAKWNAVSLASYRPVAKITVNSDKVSAILTPDQRKQVCDSDPDQVLVYDEKTQSITVHPDGPLRCTYNGEFIETLADILHPPSSNNNSTTTSNNISSVKTRFDEEEDACRKTLRHPTELVHPLISMIPSNDQFLMPIVSNGSFPPRQILFRALAAMRKRLFAIQILNRRITFNM